MKINNYFLNNLIPIFLHMYNYSFNLNIIFINFNHIINNYLIKFHVYYIQILFLYYNTFLIKLMFKASNKVQI